jgi:hypothetical protein
LQNYYGGDKQQMLFRSTELTALGLVAGTTITAIKLNLVTADATLALQNLVMKMKNSTSTTMAAWETGLTTVRTAASYIPAVGLNTITLTTPFVWNGTNNLVIEINYSNANTGTTGSTFNTAKYSATSFVSTRFYRVDNATAATIDAFTGTPSNTYSQRNDVTFDYNIASNITWGPVTGLYNELGATTAYTGICQAFSTRYPKLYSNCNQCFRLHKYFNSCDNGKSITNSQLQWFSGDLLYHEFSSNPDRDASRRQFQRNRYNREYI